MIRRLERSDLADFRSVRLDALRLHPEAFGSSYEEEAHEALEEFARFLARPCATFGAVAGDTLVGIAGLHVSPRLKQRHRGKLVGVYVDAAFRRSGLARGLTETVISAARQARLRSLSLAVTVGNAPARRLYASLGFQSYGIERRTLLVNGVLHDEELMALDLD